MEKPNHAYFMQLALKEAQRAYDEDEVPIGAIIVMNNGIIARGYNMTEKLNDPTAHAEMIALTSAFSFLGSKYLKGATLYVTVEPCMMCAGAMFWGKIDRLVYGARDEKFGSLSSRLACPHSSPYHPKTEIIQGILAQDCAWLMKSFFESKRL